MDVFFSPDFIEHYHLYTLKSGNIIYPFALIDFNGRKSMTSIGYQGPFVNNTISAEDISIFKESVAAFITEHSINAQFIRFNPVIQNHIPVSDLFPITSSSAFLNIDTTGTYEDYLSSRETRYRNALKGTEEIEIIDDMPPSLSIIRGAFAYRNEFVKDMDGLEKVLHRGFARLISALYKGREIAASLFFMNEHSAYYILNYSIPEGKTENANLAILNYIIKQAFSSGIEYVGLGGGVNLSDTLYKFKEQFATDILHTMHAKISYSSDIKDEGFFPGYLSDVFLPDFILRPKQ